MTARPRYKPRTALYVACWLAALGYAQWRERLRATQTVIDLDIQAGLLLLQFAHDQLGKAVALAATGKRIEGFA